MAAQWPLSIQQLLDENYTEQDVPRYIKSDVEIGPQKTRTVYTKERRQVSCSILADKINYQTIIDFINITLAGGSLPFDFKQPLTGQMLTWVFQEPPTFTMEGPIWMRVNMVWAEL